MSTVKHSWQRVNLRAADSSQLHSELVAHKHQVSQQAVDMQITARQEYKRYEVLHEYQV